MDNEELSDTDLFNEAMNDGETVAQDPLEQPETVAADPDKPAGDPPADPDKPAVDDNAPQVPSWRVREINEEKRQLADRVKALEAERLQWEQRNQQQPREQPQEEKKDEIDPLLDPKGYAKQVREDVMNQLLAERREESLQNAAEKYKDEFAEAYQAAQQKIDPALKARMHSSRNPGETLIQWHREQKTMREVGNDPNAWLEKKLEERLKDPTFLAKAVELARGSASQAPQSTSRPRVELPPSLSTATRSNAALRSGDNQEVSDRELFQQIAG